MFIEDGKNSLIDSARKLQVVARIKEFEALLKQQAAAEIPKDDFLRIEDFLESIYDSLGLIMSESAFKYFMYTASLLEEDDLSQIEEDDLVNNIVAMVGYRKTINDKQIIGVRSAYCKRYGTFGILFLIEALLDSNKASAIEKGDVLTIKCGPEDCMFILDKGADELYDLLSKYSSIANKLLFDKLSRKILHFTSYQKAASIQGNQKAHLAESVTGF